MITSLIPFSEIPCRQTIAHLQYSHRIIMPPIFHSKHYVNYSDFMIYRANRYTLEDMNNVFIFYSNSSYNSCLLNYSSIYCSHSSGSGINEIPNYI